MVKTHEHTMHITLLYAIYSSMNFNKTLKFCMGLVLSVTQLTKYTFNSAIFISTKYHSYQNLSKNLHCN